MKSKLFKDGKYLGELIISDIPTDLDIKKFKEELEKLSKAGGILVIDSELDQPSQIRPIKTIPNEHNKKQ